MDFLFCHLKMMHTGEVKIDFFFPTVEIEDYNVMVNGKSIFDQPVEKENIQTIATDQGDD